MQRPSFIGILMGAFCCPGSLIHTFTLKAPLFALHAVCVSLCFVLIVRKVAEVAVAHGTTSVVADPHEIANVMGLDGVHYMIQDSKVRHHTHNSMSYLTFSEHAAALSRRGTIMRARDELRDCGCRAWSILFLSLSHPSPYLKLKRAGGSRPYWCNEWGPTPRSVSPKLGPHGPGGLPRRHPTLLFYLSLGTIDINRI